MVAAANGFFKMEGGKSVPDVSKLDLQMFTQGYLCTMCDINPNQSLLQFPIVDTQQVAGAVVNPLMRLLSMQDSFVIGSMSYFIMMYPFITNQQNPDFTPTGGSYWTPITYPSGFHNTNPIAFPFVAPEMGLFWSTGSYLSLEVDKKVVIPQWDCARHLYVPQQQANMYPAAGGNPSQWPLYQDQYDGATDSYYPMEPTVVLGGGRQNVWKLNLPANIPSTIAPFNYPGYGTTFVMKAVLMFRGILAQNSTSVK